MYFIKLKSQLANLGLTSTIYLNRSKKEIYFNYLSEDDYSLAKFDTLEEAELAYKKIEDFIASLDNSKILDIIS